MKPTDFSFYLHKFLTEYLPDEKGCSANTIDSYRYSFILFLKFLDSSGLKADRFVISDLTYEIVVAFLNHLEKDRHVSVKTRNARLAAIISFIRFLSLEYPDYLDTYNKILSIHFKKTQQHTVPHLDVEEIKLLISMTDKNTIKGYRDFMIIFILYETGVRVSELVNIRIKDLHDRKPYYLKVCGKGNKERLIPVARKVVEEIKLYIQKTKLDKRPVDQLMFPNRHNDQLTRAAISYILDKYASMARIEKPELIPERVTPHVLRHSKAMHLLQSGVNLVYIRDFLGHNSIQTTEIYARANSKAKQEAIESSYTDIYPIEEPEWQDSSILEWLKRFN